ncbi:hypothetical protein [Halomicronema sp. CCY15110]|uniref:hypothetical protein n=1 Tax=Halomicronema sp. CCY15110 TaxID=2767773 RepID=UPI00195255F7|nr:hypothetical protein [Halomicronema sp. CCY15110]
MASGARSGRRSPPLNRWIALFLLSMLGPPLLMSLSWILPGAIAVIQTGSCPPAPPDIPAYPCSLGQYLVRMTVGAWALMGHLLTWMAWFAVNFVLWGVGLFGVALYRNWRSH